MKCCNGLGEFGKCGRGLKKGCTGAHCRCMEKDCLNMHYVDCSEHYIHVEHSEPVTQEWKADFMDFYFERGKFQGRLLGPDGYVKFISKLLEQSLQKRDSELIDTCVFIVHDETPKHITREYNETDQMRDRVCKRILALSDTVNTNKNKDK